MTATASTRERLLAAARTVVEADGYGAASVVAVAEAAGVATGTLYRHFASKEELLVELFRSVCDREIEVMGEASKQPGDRELDRLLGVLGTFAERALRRPRLAWALVAEPVDPAVDAERLHYRARYARLLEERLRDAVAGGEIPEQPVALTAAALVGGCAEALVGPLSDAGADPDATVAAILTLARRAVGA